LNQFPIVTSVIDSPTGGTFISISAILCAILLLN
jgi:hypothetical protein